MTGIIDPTVGYYGWNLPDPDQKNNTGFTDGSMEQRYWPIYREFFYMMQAHAELKDVSGLKWHMKMMELTKEKIVEMIAAIKIDADNEQD